MDLFSYLLYHPLISFLPLGVAITWSMKKIFVELFGKYNFTAFYRKKPALINIVSVALECWHIFLSVVFVTGRAAILILLALFFIGRIDRKFLADDISKIECFFRCYPFDECISHSPPCFIS